MSDPLEGLIAQGLPKGLPENAEPFSAVNGTDLTVAATPQVIKAAVAGSRMFITQATAINKTTTEDAVTLLNDEDDVLHAVMLPADADGVGASRDGVYTFDPPLVIAKGKALECTAIGDLGDVRVAVNGYTGT
jgi:hypothetical protein